MKALIIDQVSQNIRPFLEKNGADVDYVFLPTHDELRDMIGKYDLLVMRVDPRIDKEILDAAVNLKAITIHAVGTNHVDLKYAAEKGITVTNAPGMNHNTVAEMTVLKMLECARNSVPANNAVKNHHWNKYVWMGTELTHKTLGIIGIGKIGTRVVELMRGFEMNVIAFDPYLTAEQVAERGGKQVTMDELLAQADVISIHCPLNEETVNLIAAPEFMKMKDGAIVLNMARGGIVNEEAVYDALKSGKIRSYGADVMAAELSGKESPVRGEMLVDSPLFELDNFVISPHIAGGGTIDGLDTIGECVMNHICRLFGYSR